MLFGAVQFNAPWLEQLAGKPGTGLQPRGHPINSTSSSATPDCVMALKMQPLWIIRTPAHISIRFGASSIPFGFEISWRGCYLGAMWKKKKKEKLYNPSYAYGKKKTAVFWLTARDAEIYPCENDLHLQSDFDLQAVELNSTSLVLCFPHRLSVHSPNIYWAPTVARPGAAFSGRPRKEAVRGWIRPDLCVWGVPCFQEDGW